jgi:hypothetical protein
MVLNRLSKISTTSTSDAANLHAILVEQKAWQMLFFHAGSVLGGNCRELVNVNHKEVNGRIVFGEPKVFV